MNCSRVFTANVATVLAFSWAFASCQLAQGYTFPARQFDVPGACLLGFQSLAQLDGADTGIDCGAVCLFNVASYAAGSSALYLSTHCPPYPDGFDTAIDPALCAVATTAWNVQSYCQFPDAGATVASDAGADDGSEDASAGDSASAASDAGV